MHGGGAWVGVCGRGACVTGGMHGRDVMHGRGVVHGGGHAWQDGVHHIQSMSRWYTSYWNAFMLSMQ